MIIKNSNIRRALVNSRYKIIVTIIAIILILIIIRTVNDIETEQVRKKLEQKNQMQNTYVQEEIKQSGQTIISGNDVSQERQTEYKKLIDNFINACNQKEIQKAYQYLTDECKEELYNSKIQLFEKIT